MTKNEESNFKEFGDVIFIDGTHIKLNLKWEVIPITLIDKNKNIQCGGILYASLFNEEVIVWFIELLLKFDFVKQNLETIITDEDAAFLIAFNTVFRNPFDTIANLPITYKDVLKMEDKKVKEDDPLKTIFTIKHILCAFHKTKNFLKKINSLGFCDEEKESFEYLFDQICYSSNHDKAMEHLGKLLEVPKLRNNLEKEVVPYLHMFARSCLNGSHCLRYNVTSPAESMNHMLKKGLPDKMLTLVFFFV